MCPSDVLRLVRSILNGETTRGLTPPRSTAVYSIPTSTCDSYSMSYFFIFL